MDVFFDFTGTLTTMESENKAFAIFVERIKNRLSINMDTPTLIRKIEEYRLPLMEQRDKHYTPIRYLILQAVEHITGKKLCAEDSFWIMDEYARVHSEYLELAPGAAGNLKKLKSEANHLGLITDADRPYTERALKSLGIIEIFDSITTAEDAGIGKPNPRIFELALKNAHSPVKIYVGDNEKRDIVGAKNVGMIAIKVGSESSVADYNAKDVTQAVEIILTKIRE